MNVDGKQVQRNQARTGIGSTRVARLLPPPHGSIEVAFVVAPGAELVDFAGPWGVFEYAAVPDRHEPAFSLWTVAESRAPIDVSGGLTVVPKHSFADAPTPRVASCLPWASTHRQ